MKIVGASDRYLFLIAVKAIIRKRQANALDMTQYCMRL